MSSNISKGRIQIILGQKHKQTNRAL